MGSQQDKKRPARSVIGVLEKKIVGGKKAKKGVLKGQRSRRSEAVEAGGLSMGGKKLNRPGQKKGERAKEFEVFERSEPLEYLPEEGYQR